MKLRHLLLALSILASVSCHKGSTPSPNPPPKTNVVRLKDINWPHLPSPFYHFEYNDAGYITNASFSSDLGTYALVYADKKLLRMETTRPNRDSLKYTYLDGDVVAINIVDNHGFNYRRATLSYTSSHQLQRLDWEIKVADADFTPEQTLKLSYFTDGNLKELVTHYYTVGPQTEAEFTDSFDDYDDKVNVDAFSLLHPDQFHHLFLLPGVKIQLNNPHRNVRTGDGVNYKVNYNYNYDAAGRPLSRIGDLVWTAGKDSGQHFQVQTTFSYYD